MAANNDLVLITGATGHLGFPVLRYALEHGYKVRAAVRSESKIEVINSGLERTKSTPKDSSQLSFAIVPDIVASNAYDKATQGVKYVIHVASPLSTTQGDYEENIITPALKGTVNMLEAARKAESVKRVVITSSVIAITEIGDFLGVEAGSTRGPYTAESRILPTPKGPFEHPFVAYHASKVGALNAAEAWVKEQKPNFELTHIHPSYIEGRNDLATSTEDFQSGTNRLIANLALGAKAENALPISTNHVDDTALIHVKALDEKVPSNQSFIVSNSGEGKVEWNDVVTVVKKQFPQAVEQGILKLDGNTPSFYLKYDIEKTEKTLGIKLQGFDEQVKSVVGHYLEVYQRENGSK